MFERIRLVKNIKSTFEYLKPYFSLNSNNAVRIFTAFFSLVSPVIESLIISSNSKLIFKSTTDEDFNTKNKIKLFILSYGIYCLSYSLRSALNKTLVESLKKDIKLNNIKTGSVANFFSPVYFQKKSMSFYEFIQGSSF